MRRTVSRRTLCWRIEEAESRQMELAKAFERGDAGVVRWRCENCGVSRHSRTPRPVE
jgi:hypothetical protein